MNLEVSNLCEYTPNQLSLLIAGVDLKIKANKEFIDETYRWGDDFVKLHKDTLVRLSRDNEELYAIRIALLTVHAAVRKQQTAIDG
jgi:hypothetical protein